MNRIYLSLLLITLATEGTAQITGRVIDSLHKLPIEFAHVFIQGTPIGVITNSEGEFELSVPLEHVGKSLIVSRLGYVLDTISTSQTKKNILITLSEQTIQLSESLIKPIIPLDILRKTVSRIAQNYPSEPTYLSAYYREIVKTDTVFVKYADAACKIYYCGYSTPYHKGQAVRDFYYLDLQQWDKKQPFPNAKNIVPHQDDAVLVLASRKSNDLEQFTNRWDFEEGLKKINVSGGPLHLTATDIVKLKKDMLDTSTWKYYQFKFEGLLDGAQGKVYKISFRPKKNKEIAIWQGVMYIEQDSYALIELEYAVTEAGKKYLREKNSEIIIERRDQKSQVKRIIKHTNQHVRVSYANYQDKWYLSHIRIVNEIENTGNLFETITYSTYIDLYVNGIQTYDVKPFRKDEAFHTNYFNYLYHAPSSYAPDFWRNYNTPVPTEWLKTALKDIEVHKSLQEQFQDAK